jgi:hypothetical protein
MNRLQPQGKNDEPNAEPILNRSKPKNPKTLQPCGIEPVPHFQAILYFLSHFGVCTTLKVTFARLKKSHRDFPKNYT